MGEEVGISQPLGELNPLADQMPTNRTKPNVVRPSAFISAPRPLEAGVALARRRWHWLVDLALPTELAANEKESEVMCLRQLHMSDFGQFLRNFVLSIISMPQNKSPPLDHFSRNIQSQLWLISVSFCACFFYAVGIAKSDALILFCLNCFYAIHAVIVWFVQSSKALWVMKGYTSFPRIATSFF